MAHISENGVKKICEICDRYTNEKTPLMMILSDIQNEYGYIPLEVQKIVSQKTGISVAEIYGVVTFYSFFSLEPKGKYVIGCCLGTACYVKGAQQIIDQFCEILKIKPGQTTEDGLFTVDALRNQELTIIIISLTLYIMHSPSFYPVLHYFSHCLDC